MLNLRQPWQTDPKGRNAQRDENLAEALLAAENRLAAAMAELTKIRQNVGNPEEFWNRPNGAGVDYGLTRGRSEVVARAVADAQREVHLATEHMVAAVALASSYEVEGSES